MDRVLLVGGILQGLFFIPSQVLGPEHNFWKLSTSEAKDLAQAVVDVLDTLPAKQGKKLEKLLKEYGPYIKLAMVGIPIVGLRVSASVSIVQKQKANELEFRTIQSTPDYGQPGAYGTGPAN